MLPCPVNQITSGLDSSKTGAQQHNMQVLHVQDDSESRNKRNSCSEYVNIKLLKWRIPRNAADYVRTHTVGETKDPLPIQSRTKTSISIIREAIVNSHKLPVQKTNSLLDSILG